MGREANGEGKKNIFPKAPSYYDGSDDRLQGSRGNGDAQGREPIVKPPPTIREARGGKSRVL